MLVCVCVYVCMYACVGVCVSEWGICMWVCIWVERHAYTCGREGVCTYICIYIYICIYVCVCVGGRVGACPVCSCAPVAGKHEKCEN